jgi:hypothetical protein
VLAIVVVEIMRHDIHDVRTQLCMIKNYKILNPKTSTCLNRPNIEKCDENCGGGDEAGNSGRGFFIKYESNYEFTQNDE